MILIEYYGTLLDLLVLKELDISKKALSVKEIALMIHIYDSKRQQVSFERRIRRAIKRLEDNEAVQSQQRRIKGNNLIINKYSITEDGRRQKELVKHTKEEIQS